MPYPPCVTCYGQVVFQHADGCDYEVQWPSMVGCPQVGVLNQLGLAVTRPSLHPPISVMGAEMTVLMLRYNLMINHMNDVQACHDR